MFSGAEILEMPFSPPALLESRRLGVFCCSVSLCLCGKKFRRRIGIFGNSTPLSQSVVAGDQG